MKNIFIFVVLLGLNVLGVQAQKNEQIRLDQLDYKLKVKQLDEFIRRFNLQESPDMFKNSDTLIQKMYCLTALFDFNVVKSREKEVREFVTAMIDKNAKIAFTDTTWNAVAKCNVLYKGKHTTVTLQLATEHVRGYIYKWVITGASGKILNLTPQKQNEGMMISPVDNEVNFISLKNVTTTEALNILQYKSKKNSVDALSVFFTLVHSGMLTVQNVQQLEYTFHVPGYQFTVHNFVRDAMNSGWLISDFKKM